MTKNIKYTQFANLSAHNKQMNLCSTVKALYFVVFPMNIISLEFYFADFALVTLLQCTAKMFA